MANIKLSVGLSRMSKLHIRETTNFKLKLCRGDAQVVYKEVIGAPWILNLWALMTNPGATSLPTPYKLLCSGQILFHRPQNVFKRTIACLSELFFFYPVRQWMSKVDQRSTRIKQPTCDKDAVLPCQVYQKSLRFFSLFSFFSFKLFLLEMWWTRFHSIKVLKDQAAGIEMTRPRKVTRTTVAVFGSWLFWQET